MQKKNSFSSTEDIKNQLHLLELEYNQEKESYQEQSESMQILRKVKRGICWFPLAIGKSYYNSLNNLVVEVERTEDKEIDHLFEPGKTVNFFTPDLYTGTGKNLSFTGQVSYVNENRMVIAVTSPDVVEQIREKEQIGVQLYFDETSYKTMFESLRQLIKTENRQLIRLREVCLGSASPEYRSTFPVRFPWINPSQEKAVNKVLSAKEVAIVHGPPGTGKTTTLVEAIYETLHRENQILVCAQSNTAVDWISEKLADRGIPLLRVGNPTRVNDKMLSYTYERQFESHPDYPELWKLRRTIRELGGAGKSRTDTRLRKIASLKERCTELEITIHESLFRQARVVASTLIGSNNRILTGRHFSTLFIDEAGQALEAACWTAIRKADRVILAGDHLQLPPTVKSPEALRKGLGKTLLEKLAENKPESVSLLQTQYRMHEDIMHFSSRWFYEGKLQAAPEVRSRGILDYDTPLVWYDTSLCRYQEEFIGEHFGRINKPEAELLLAETEKYIKRIGVERVLEERIDIGIISPYKSQIQYLKRRIRQITFFKPLRSLISINTVDGFQGQERDVIILSLVRANEHKEIGFLTDLRRMNVAITRARMKVILIGDASTLTHHKFYKELYNYIEEKGKVVLIQADNPV